MACSPLEFILVRIGPRTHFAELVGIQRDSIGMDFYVSVTLRSDLQRSVRRLNYNATEA